MHPVRHFLVSALLVGGVFLSLHSVSRSEEPAADSKQSTNRLAKESSLYLTMHGHNPVDWYPWGEEALKKAKAENKPIFLSIGYASCHWCHVMERESFMDAEIAKILKENFVSIKVDREERPDIDFLYMTALHALNGRGGWPLTMFLTPDAKPVIGGTYFPPRAKDEQAGFLEFATAVKQKFADDPTSFAKQGERVTAHLQELMRQRPVILGSLDEATFANLTAALAEDFDPEHGGFGYSPEQPKKSKFPQPSILMYLLDRATRNPDERKAKTMLLTTLTKMAQGGICDQVGGGFHRYSTDRFWRVPHFEKMLYDNGQLATLYAEAYALTDRADFRRVTVQLLDFVLREMTSPDGAFYASQDADTEGGEGRAYVWSSKELEETLSQDELAIFLGAYGLGEQIDDEGRHVIVMHKPLAETAVERGLTELALEEQLQPLRQKLLARRHERPKPTTDAKILTAWNGLMIRGLADGGRILNEPRYVQAAARAADFILAKLVTPEGRLMRSYAAGEARLPGYLDDYAFFVDGLIALHRATGDQKWLDAADRLTAKQIELFADDRAGGFYFTASDHEELIARSKDPTDGDTPAGNSVAAANLLYLAGKLNKPAYTKQAEATLRGVIPLFDRSPSHVTRMTTVLAEWFAMSKK